MDLYEEFKKIVKEQNEDYLGYVKDQEGSTLGKKIVKESVHLLYAIIGELFCNSL